MQKAPFFQDIDGGPADGAAWWVTTQDGAQLRVGVWNRNAPKGTILLFPGRTEYIEKYGITATEMAPAGFATCAIDWRGQGLAQRLASNPLAGHVARFSDYQHDVTAMLKTANALDLPRPFYLLAHSMGGAIGLRALINDLRINAAAFSGPMWGIYLSPLLRPVASTIACIGTKIGLATSIVPNSTKQTYVQVTPFQDNDLTNDPAMYQRMVTHAAMHPELTLAGPTYQWLSQALKEIKDLKKRPSPPVPCLTILGSDERIVDAASVTDRMARWPDSRLETFPRGRHEVLMDSTAMRARANQLIIDHFLAHG